MTTLEALAHLATLAPHVEVTFSDTSPTNVLGEIPDLRLDYGSADTVLHGVVEGVTVTCFGTPDACHGAVAASRQMAEVGA